MQVARHWESTGRKLGCFPSPPSFPLCPNPRATGHLLRDWCCCGKAKLETRVLPPLPWHLRPAGASQVLPKWHVWTHMEPWV